MILDIFATILVGIVIILAIEITIMFTRIMLEW